MKEEHREMIARGVADSRGDYRYEDGELLSQHEGWEAVDPEEVCLELIDSKGVDAFGMFPVRDLPSDLLEEMKARLPDYDIRTKKSKVLFYREAEIPGGTTDTLEFHIPLLAMKKELAHPGLIPQMQKYIPFFETADLLEAAKDQEDEKAGQKIKHCLRLRGWPCRVRDVRRKEKLNLGRG